jgi:hypothetical protein
MRPWLHGRRCRFHDHGLEVPSRVPAAPRSRRALSCGHTRWAKATIYVRREAPGQPREFGTTSRGRGMVRGYLSSGAVGPVSLG